MSEPHPARNPDSDDGKSLDGMILVTGGTGFLGRNLCPYLVQRGYRVRVLVRADSDVEYLRDLEGVELCPGDVCEPGSLFQALAGCRWVVHAAGKWRFWGRPEEFYTANVEGTANMARAALAAGVERFVYVSTLAVVGAPRRGQLLDEQMACFPRDAYQRSKLEAEGLLLSAYREARLAAVILRPGAFYGPWGRYGFNRMFFEDPLKGLPLGIHSGKRITFPIFVPDLVKAIEAALECGRPGEIYNVVGSCPTHAEVHATVSRLAGIRAWRINPPAAAMVALARLWTWWAWCTGAEEPYYSINMVPYIFCDWRATSDKARRELGFAPTSFEEGARQTLAWYRTQAIGPANWLGRMVLRLWHVAPRPPLA